MISFKRINAIIGKDLKESVNNKVILVAILLPLFASLLFGFLNNSDTPRNFNLAITEVEEKKLVDYLQNNYANLQVEYYREFNEAMDSVENGKNEALITQNNSESFAVYINNQSPVIYLFLKETINEILLDYKNINFPLDISATPVNTPRTRYSILPTWIMITVTMIGVMIISGNFAEEKDNGTLAAIRISPVKKLEILFGKGLFGVIISSLTVILMLIFNGVYRDLYVFLMMIPFIFLASFCFTAAGLFIGSLASSQSAARSIGTIIYFPLIFPALIYEFSGITKTIARLFPTYYLLTGLQKLLFNGVNIYQLRTEIIFLLLFAIIFSSLTTSSFRKEI